MIKFMPYRGKDLIGLHTNENHYNFKFNDPDCRILFSITRKGNAIFAHLASNKKGLRKLKAAIKDFCEFIFWLYDWCEMIIATIDRASLGRWLRQIGFFKILQKKDDKNIQVWMKAR